MNKLTAAFLLSAAAAVSRASEVASGRARIEIPRTHNVHSTIGIRYGF